jgi:hypothetical protein
VDIIEGLIHSKISSINNNRIIRDNMKDNTNSVNNIGFNGDDLISNPLEDLLWNL